MAYSQEQIIKMLQRSYLAGDGLWFVKVEALRGVEEALELDNRVWQVMPKIQARRAREVLSLSGQPLQDIAACFGLKLTAEGHAFEVTHTAETTTIKITNCPWRNTLEKAGRMHLASEIASRICTSEGHGWAREFGLEFQFSDEDTMCNGGGSCGFVFRLKTVEPPV